MLAVLRKLCECDRYVRSGKWKKGDYMSTTKFTGSQSGLSGWDRSAWLLRREPKHLAARSFTTQRTEKANWKYKSYPSIVELASNCNILVVACPLMQETRCIVNHQVMDALGLKCVLINIGRYPHVGVPELVEGIDVFEHEPEVPKSLFWLENVVLLYNRNEEQHGQLGHREFVSLFLEQTTVNSSDLRTWIHSVLD